GNYWMEPFSSQVCDPAGHVCLVRKKHSRLSFWKLDVKMGLVETSGLGLIKLSLDKASAKANKAEASFG
ncbi:hypothetical protein DCC39_18575, partial [Pueribacillus theae]